MTEIIDLYIYPKNYFEITLLLFTLTLFLLKLIQRIILLTGLRKKNNGIEEFDKPLSVIICARNEAENLKKHIPLICEQKYHNFEVIVVNDASTDNSRRVLFELQEKYKNLKFTTINKDDKFDHGKKLAQTIGIKSAWHDHFVMTDADCYPNSENWLAQISSHFKHKSIILGYGPYKTEKGLLNKIIRFDTLAIGVKYLAMAKTSFPYMAVGRNMAYTRDIYNKAGGFSSHYHLQSGDDDLFINKIARRKNTAIEINQDAFTYSIPKNNYRSWIRQKKRHLQTGSKYKFKHKLFLGVDTIIQILFYPSIIASTLLLINNIILFLSIISGLIILDLLWWKIIMNRMKEKGFLLFIPIFEVFIAFLPLILGLKNYIQARQAKWN